MKKHAGSVALIMALGVLLTSAASAEAAEEKKEWDPNDYTTYGLGEFGKTMHTMNQKCRRESNVFPIYGDAGRFGYMGHLKVWTALIYGEMYAHTWK